MKASIGPAWAPSQAAEPAALEHRLDDPERGRDREQVHQRGLHRDHERAEHHEQQQRGERDHDADEQRELAREHVREVDLRSGRAADVDASAACLLGGGITSLRSRVTRLEVWALCGAAVG